jgi:hypothetical protein
MPVTKKGKAKPRPRLKYCGTRRDFGEFERLWEAIPPKGYRITGSLDFGESKVFVGIKRKEADRDE